MQTILDTAKLLGMPLSPGQEAVLRLTYGLEITEPEQVRLALKATGRAELGSPRHYLNSHLLAGRRSGKSTRIVALIAIHEALFAGHVIPEHETSYLPVIGPTETQSRKTFKTILALLKSRLPGQIVGEPRFSAGESEVELASRVIISVAAARSNSVRGGACVAVIFEEAAHFGREDKSANPLSEIAGSLRPSLLTHEATFAKMLFVSSPWVKSGVMFEAWRDSRMNESYTLVCQLPSRDLNPSLSEIAMKAQKFLQGESWYMREYESQFVDSGEPLIPADDIDRAVVRGRESFLPEKGNTYVAGFDLSARGDDSALGIAHSDSEKVVWLDFCQLWRRPTGANTIDPFQVLEQSCAVMKQYGVTRAFSDQVLQSVVEHTVRKFGVQYNRTITFGTGAAAMYRVVRELFVTNKIRLPENKTLISQLKSLEQKFLDGGGSAVAAVRGKDDLGVAACLSIFQAHQLGTTSVKPWFETIRVSGREPGGWKRWEYGNEDKVPFGSHDFGELGSGSNTGALGIDWGGPGGQTATVDSGLGEKK